MSANNFRLPRLVIPNHYDITLDLDMEAFTFQGEVGIDLETLETVETIVLNTAEIEISSASLIVDGEPIEVTEIAYDEKYERATLTLAQQVAAGEHRLEITYRGLINDQLRGLYRSVYKDADGAEHPIATSQCQATDARRVIPSWDEPNFKATFQTTMIVPAGTEAYSNTSELQRESLENGKVKFSFDKTMKMSTYLLAFVAGPFEATEPVMVRDTPIRIIVPKGNVHLTDVALENAIFCFEYLTDYYDIPYPGDKLDHIAVPDFAAGAMENVGLITYRDSYLIIDRAKATQDELLRSVDVIGHEIAHQWFGNLVTMAWWEGAWLNEAFASFMEMKATHAMRPEWKRWLTFANLEVPWAMGTDQLASTRPIEFEVKAPEEVDQMFDAITYGKGSAVLHMIDEFMGVENFRKGVGSYLRKHAYANTVTGDLWEGLDSASDWPISEIMDTWVYQRGFPQVEVTRVTGGVHLSQRRHMVIPDETDTTLWKVPIRLRGSSDGEAFDLTVLLEEPELMVALEDDIDWVIGNGWGHGFYRTNYSPELFSGLLANLDQLDDLERYALVSDTLAFVRNGEVDSSSFLDLVSNFADEKEQAIWSVIVGGLGMIEHHALDESIRPAFEGFVAALVGPALERLGWDPDSSDSDLDRKLRGELVATMGVLAKDRPTIGKCRTIVDELIGGGSPDPEVGAAALAVFGRHADADDYKRLWETYLESTTSLDQVRYLRALAGVAEEGLALETLDKILDGVTRSQDSFWVFARLTMGKSGGPVWNAAASRWDDLLASMPGLTKRRLVEGIPALSQPEVAAGVKAFLTENMIPEASQAIEQNLEKLDANVRLRTRETPVVRKYFS